MAAKKILFLVGDFGEDYEVMVPFQALTDGLRVAGASAILGVVPRSPGHARFPAVSWIVDSCHCEEPAGRRGNLVEIASLCSQ
jgi:hypothetical protein